MDTIPATGPSFLYPEGNYRLAGGYVTTDGTIGELSIDNILDYRIEIGGPVPYVFETDPGHTLTLNGLIASMTSLQVSSGGTSRGRFSIFEDNPTHLCADCVRYVSWFGAEDFRPMEVLYEVEDSEHAFVPNLSIVGTISQVGAATTPMPPDPSSVPEPSSALIWLLLGALSIARRRTER